MKTPVVVQGESGFGKKAAGGGRGGARRGRTGGDFVEYYVVPRPLPAPQLQVQRLTFFSGCAISVVEEMDEEAVLAGVAEEDRLQVFADAVQAVVTEEYKVLEEMVETRAADRGAVAAPYSMCTAGAAPGGVAPGGVAPGLSDKSNDAAWNSW